MICVYSLLLRTNYTIKFELFVVKFYAKHLLLVLSLVCIHAITKAQDVHFTQFNAAPLTINPSNTGNYDGFWRLSSNYRNQWRVLNIPFHTFSLAFDKKISPKSKNFAYGLMVLTDQSGEANINFKKIFGSIGIHLGSDQSRFSIGIQPGFIIKTIDLNGLTFPAQYDPSIGVFNGDLATNEPKPKESLAYPDVNLGVSWRKTSERSIFNIGFALYHLLTPQESFWGNDYTIPLRKVIHTSFNFNINDKVSLIPKLLFMEQNKASELVVGSYLAHAIPKNQQGINSLFFGVMTRTGFNRTTDAIMAVMGANLDRWDIGLSYDFNISPLQESTNRRGAYEISAVFWSGETKYKRKTVICERL